MVIVFGKMKRRSQAQNVDQTDMETEEYRTRIELLYEIAQEASSVSDVSKLLERILRVTQQTLGASAALLLLIKDIKGELYFQVVLGEAGAKLDQMKLSPESGIAGWVARNATPVLANDVTTDSHFERKMDEITGFVTESIIAVPLLRGQSVIGVLEVLNKSDGGNFTERDLRVLEGIASTEALILLVSMANTAINNINSLALDHALLDGYRSTAEAWARAVDTKDSYAYAHSRRVREYALLTANYLSLSPQELRAIELGALFHDIGKIGIDSRILCKPGPLTDNERRIMHEHSRKGADIISEIPFLEKAKDIVLYHHERYDGKGYPEGLRGIDIPIGARLVAVADAFDTMTTDHSYREALSVNRATTELIEGIGTQFCPVAVESFVAAFRKRGTKLAREEKPERVVTEEAEGEPEEVKDEIPAQSEDDNITSETYLEPEEVEDEIPAQSEDDNIASEAYIEPEALAGETPAWNEVNAIAAEIYQGNVRLMVPLTAGFKEVRQFKAHLGRVENLKIVLISGSEEKGHLILLTVKEPMALIRVIREIPVVESVDKRGKDIIVTLKDWSG